MSSSASATFPTPVTLDTLPGNGSKAVTIPIAWALVPVTPGRSGNDNRVTQTINLLSQFQTGQFVNCQSVYIDNLTCSYGVSLTSTENGQKLTCPPFSSGSFPLLCGAAPIFTVELVSDFFAVAGGSVDNSSTILHFLNTPARTYVSQGAGIYPINKTSAFSANSGNPITGDITAILAGELGTPAVPGGLDVAKHYLINGLKICITLLPPPAGAAPSQQIIQLIESGNSGPTVLWSSRMSGSNTVAEVIFDETITFPVPILQRDGGNVLALSTFGFFAVATPYLLDAQLFLSIVRVQ